MSGISRENIVVLGPSVLTSSNGSTIDNFRDLQSAISHLSASKAFNSSCWNYIDYLGPSVSLNLLISVIQGDRQQATFLSGIAQPRVLSVYILMDNLSPRMLLMTIC